MNRLDLTDFLNDTMRCRLNSVSVWQDGAELARHEAEETTLTNIHSGSKAFVSAAVGCAVREKLLSLEERVVDCFPESCPAEIPELLGELRLKHLLTMSMGFAHPLLMGGDNRKRLLHSEPDWTAFCLRQPIRDVPGSVFRYSNAGPYLLGVLIQ